MLNRIFNKKDKKRKTQTEESSHSQSHNELQSQTEESRKSQTVGHSNGQSEDLSTHTEKSSSSNFSRKRLSSDIVQSTQSFYLYSLEGKIIDLTGPIQQNATKIRGKAPVNWQPYLQSEVIEENDYDFITAFQKTKTISQREKLLDEYKNYSGNTPVDAIANSIIKICYNFPVVANQNKSKLRDLKCMLYHVDAYKTLLKIPECVRYTEEIHKVLVLIDDLLWEDLSRIHRFKEAADDPWKPFFNLLSHKDEFVKNLASRIITKLLGTDAYKPALSDTNFFLNWLKNEIQHDNEYLLCVARCLQKLLRYDEFRLAFHRQNGILRIVRLLMRPEIKQQAQYQFAFCIWLLSMNVELAKRLKDYDIIEVFVGLLKTCPIEIIKLPRVILATFRNLLYKPTEPEIRKSNALAMIQFKLFTILDAVKERSKQFTDPELQEDFEVVYETLTSHVAELSTFDVYALEVRSGQLEWSVVHTSKPFWIKNSERLNENDYEILRMLISLLHTSKNSTVLCVVAHDLGEYMSHYRRGKTLVEQFGGKDALLKIINDEDPEVKYHALKCLQIMMLNNYNLLIDYAGEVRLADLLKTEKEKSEK